MRTTDQDLPELIELEKYVSSFRIEDVEAETLRELRKLQLSIEAGSSIAVAVGSRGMDNLAAIVKTVIGFVKSQGADAFIVPSMGSHGGATAAGQEEVLAGYGITEEQIGAPIRSSMDVVELPSTDVGNRVFMDRLAYESDGVILINRVKPHTDYRGFPESGLLKMATIGLGKHAQALDIHERGVTGLKNCILPTARNVFATGRIIAGVATVEDAHDRTMIVRALRPEEFEAEEERLLAVADEHLGRIPIDEADLLIVDEMGKNISGSGLDPNVIGRIKVPGQPEPETPRFSMIVVTDLTEASHGNAVGMGLADVVTRRLARKIDYAATYENAVTASFLERGKLPIVADTDEEAVRIALRGAAVVERERARIVRIRNTLQPYRLMVTRPVYDELRQHEDIRMVRDSVPMVRDGTLCPWSGRSATGSA